VVIKDKDKEDIVIVVKFKRFDEMHEEEYEEYQKLISTLINMKEGASLVTCNGPQRTRNMYALGWRASMFQLSTLNFKLL